jgi:hypothetical protein
MSNSSRVWKSKVMMLADTVSNEEDLLKDLQVVIILCPHMAESRGGRSKLSRVFHWGMNLTKKACFPLS